MGQHRRHTRDKRAWLLPQKNPEHSLHELLWHIRYSPSVGLQSTPLPCQLCFSWVPSVPCSSFSAEDAPSDAKGFYAGVQKSRLCLYRFCGGFVVDEHGSDHDSLHACYCTSVCTMAFVLQW